MSFVVVPKYLPYLQSLSCGACAIVEVESLAMVMGWLSCSPGMCSLVSEEVRGRIGEFDRCDTSSHWPRVLAWLH